MRLVHDRSACCSFSGVTVHIVEIDPVVITASIQAMGFPASALRENTSIPLPSSLPTDADQLLWQDVHDRLFLYKADAEDFVLNSSDIYDLVFVDAYDGDDIFPHKLWDPNGLFLKSLHKRLHPIHGTVAVNLHSDSEVLANGASDYSSFSSILPMGRYVSQVCRAYKKNLGFAFKVSVPWLCNITLVAGSGEGFRSEKRGVSFDRNSILNTLLSKSNLVELVLDLPFPCLQYVIRGFMVVD